MDLPTIDTLPIKDKRILLRLDLDVPVKGGKVLEVARLEAGIPTIKALLERGCATIVVLGHRGRPQGEVDENLSLLPVTQYLLQLVGREVGDMPTRRVKVLENLRFDPGEESNDPIFVQDLAKKGDIYVNDAFGVCHRESASIVGLPNVLPHAAGLHLLEEVENLSRVLNNPKVPVVIVIGGGKMDKILLIEKLLDKSEWVLVGGVLPQKVKSYCRENDGRMCIVAAHLVPSGEDITPDSARNFVEIIKAAQTIVWNGPMGDIDRGYWEGTKIVAEAVANSRGYKVAGGGDTIKVLEKLGIKDKMSYVSIGGGSMLEFLAYGDLPGLKALRSR